MEKRSRFVIALFCIIFIIPSLILSGFSFAIGYFNIYSSCDDNSDDLIKLSNWLFINAGVSICVIIMYTLFLILFIKNKQYKFIIMTLITFISNCVFVVIWNIIGSIELFKNSSDCKTKSESLWIIVLISLMFQWLGLLQICISRKCHINNILEIEDTQETKSLITNA
jgi:hypothetical protein